MRYIAGYNQPGYLPESEPEEFESFEDARSYIVEEIERAADDEAADSDETADDMEDFAEEVADEKGPSFSMLGPDGYAYWVTYEA